MELQRGTMQSVQFRNYGFLRMRINTNVKSDMFGRSNGLEGRQVDRI